LLGRIVMMISTPGAAIAFVWMKIPEAETSKTNPLCVFPLRLNSQGIRHEDRSNRRFSFRGFSGDMGLEIGG
jgi:hypothetical protein